jgi:hypothetical protein
LAGGASIVTVFPDLLGSFLAPHKGLILFIKIPRLNALFVDQTLFKPRKMFGAKAGAVGFFGACFGRAFLRGFAGGWSFFFRHKDLLRKAIAYFSEIKQI